MQIQEQAQPANIFHCCIFIFIFIWKKILKTDFKEYIQIAQSILDIGKEEMKNEEKKGNSA